MAAPQIPVFPTSPVIPPVASFPFVDRNGRLTPTAFQFLQQVWAALQGSGAIIDNIALDATGLLSGEVAALSEALANAAGNDQPAGQAPADLLARLDSLAAEIAMLRGDVAAQIQAAMADVMAWIVPTIAPALVYVPACFAPGLLTADQVILVHPFVLPAILPIDLGGAQYGAIVSATADTVITVGRAPAATPNTFSTIGTITYGAGTTAATGSTVSHLAYGFGVGDVLRLIAQHVPDLTLASLSIALDLQRQR